MAGAVAANAEVSRQWDTLWRYEPCVAKDDALLARESRSMRWQALLDHVRGMFGRLDGLRSVELGCGRGDLSILLAQRGVEITLLDTSSLALGQARRRLERLGLAGRLLQADFLEETGDLNGRFDLALSAGVVEHFVGPSRRRAMAAHVRVLRRGGLAMISVPNAHCLPYRVWKAYVELRGWWPYGKEVPFSRSELRDSAQAVGLEAIDMVGDGFLRSLGGHVVKTVTGRRPTWSDRRCWLDQRMGESLVLFGRRGTEDPSHGRLAWWGEAR